MTNLMTTSTQTQFWQTIAVGSIAGSRTSSAPAVTSGILANMPAKDLQSSTLQWLGKDSVSQATKLMAIPELIIDKMPGIGNRTDPAGLISRVVSGALCGAALYHAHQQNPVKGLLIGGLAAFGATYAWFYARKKLGEQTSIPDAFIGAAEDALVIAAGLALVKRGGRETGIGKVG